MDQSIKEAFDRVKDDINSIKNETDSLRKGLNETREGLIDICDIMIKLKESFDKGSHNPNLDSQTHVSTHNPVIPATSTDSSTYNTYFKPLNTQILPISTGNKGVSTNQQTNQQTYRQTQNTPEIEFKTDLNSPENIPQINPNTLGNRIDSAVSVLDSLDDIKKEIRLKFKRLTEQELLVFSQLYKLSEEYGHADYKSLSKSLNLTESSIRDYIGRLIKKDIPVDKTKINNKNIQLSISSNLKKVANLSTILQLRDL